MLKFIGIGSAFNTALGNTSAFYKENDKLLLIDCGGMVFHQLMTNGLLERVKTLDVIITHTHPDHVGSLGDLIFYAYYILKIKAKIYFPEKVWMEIFLKCIGVEPVQYELFDQQDSEIANEISVAFVPVEHLLTVPSYGILLKINEQTCYYSGDASNIPDTILSEFYSGRIDVVYQDTSGLEVEENPHLSMQNLERLIPEKLRSKVYCMHLDTQFDSKKACALGFQWVKVWPGF